jgi:arylsulfatase A-like enzyme
MLPNRTLSTLTPALLIVAALCGLAPADTPAPRRPHVVLIVADDLGGADVGFRGSDIATPHLDALARSGAVLDRFYAMPFCTPTRSSLMTGRYPFRYGLQTAAIPADGRYGLSLEERLLPQMLREAGYFTAIVGKWHLGKETEAHLPLSRGFATQYGAFLGEIDYFTRTTAHGPDWYLDQEPLEEEGYVTELLGDRAEKIVLSHDPDTPFFLYLPFTAPHAPFQAPEAWTARYARVEDPTRRTYAAMVSCMDAQIGRVLKALEARGMREDTLVLFFSDNGGNRTAAFSGEADVSGVSLPASNAPYRGGKGMITEGGCRVVALASWPGRIPAARIAAPIHVVDLLPTIVKLCGASTAGGRPLDGVDQWPVLAHGADPVREEVVYNVEPQRAAISGGRWKLVLKAGLPPSEALYDLETDPREERDVAADHPELAARLKARVYELAGEAETPLFFRYLAAHREKTRNILESLLRTKAASKPPR